MAAGSSGIPPEAALHIGGALSDGAPDSGAMAKNDKSAPSRAIPPTMNFVIHDRSFPQGRSDSAELAETKSGVG